jgi:hypothetical protein
MRRFTTEATRSTTTITNHFSVLDYMICLILRIARKVATMWRVSINHAEFLPTSALFAPGSKAVDIFPFCQICKTDTWTDTRSILCHGHHILIYTLFACLVGQVRWHSRMCATRWHGKNGCTRWITLITECDYMREVRNGDCACTQ